MRNTGILWFYLALSLCILLTIPSFSVKRDSRSTLSTPSETIEAEGSREGNTALNLPVWDVGNYWSLRREAHCIDYEGYEYLQWDNRTFTVESTDEMFDGYGDPVECYKLTLSGNVQNYREAELDTAEYGHDYGTVPYKTKLDATITGYLLLEKETLGRVQEYRQTTGTADIFDLEPAILNPIFGGDHDYWDYTYLNYTPPMNDYALPRNFGDTYHVSSRLDMYAETKIDLDDQPRVLDMYYLMEDDVVVSREDVTLDEGDAFNSGEPMKCMKFIFTNNGGEHHSDNPNATMPPEGGTRTKYLSTVTGWYSQCEFAEHFGQIASGYIIESNEYLKDTNYGGRDPVVTEITFIDNNVTNGGDESVLIAACITDPDGMMDLDNVEVDLDSLGLGTLELFDDGTSGDETAGDGVYSLSIDITDSVDADDYLVEVTAFDLNENEGGGSATLTVVEPNEPPQVFSAIIFPATVYNDGLTEIRLTARVSDPNGPGDIAEVLGDISDIGGNADVPMNDDGVNGDESAGDGKYSLLHVVPDTVTPGDHTVEIAVKDTAGEEASHSITVHISEFIPVISPEIIRSKSYPEEVMAGELEVLLTVEVKDENGLDTIVSVEGNLKDVSGDSTQKFYDDATNGDEKKEDGIYSYETSIPKDILSGEGVNEKIFSLPVTVTDNTYESVEGIINVTVRQPNSPPVIERVFADIDSVFNDGKEDITITAEVSDDDTLADIERVWLNLAPLDGDEIDLVTDTPDVFKTGDYTCTFKVPTSVDAGTYRVIVTVEDSKGNSATMECSVEVVERHKIDREDDDDTGPGDDDSSGDDDDATGDDDDTGGVDGDAKGSPGFGLILLLSSVIVIVVLRRRK